MDEYAYSGRLNRLDWKGCKNLWSHSGRATVREMPRGFRTVGVPGILLDDRLAEGGIELPPQPEMDELIRGLVDDQGDAEEYSPLFIIGYHKFSHGSAPAYQVALDQEKTWTVKHDSYGWIAFDYLSDMYEWLRNN